jgi:hypothetical protein
VGIYVNYYGWVAIVLLQYFMISYLSFRAAKEQTTSSLAIVWAMGLFPHWAIICKYSENLALAGFIYDFSVTAGWAIGVVVFQGKGFTIYQYLGIMLMLSGILVFKK